MSKVQLEGRLISKSAARTRRFTANIPAIELINILEPEHVYQGLEFFFDSARNKINKERVLLIERDIEGDLLGRELEPMLSLTLIISGQPEVKITNDKVLVCYQKKQAVVVDNLLLFVAILNLLGVKSPLFSSRLNSKTLERSSYTRQALAIKDISLTVIFDEQGVSDEQLQEMFFKFQRQCTGVHLTQLENTGGKFPLESCVNKLALDLKLDSLGGVSSQSKHVKLKDNFVTTEYILFKVLVGAVASSLTQEKCRMEDDVTFNRGTKVSEALSNGGMENLVVFFNAWLAPLHNGTEKYRYDFRLSAQIWQALSLTVNQLVSEGATKRELSYAGTVLGDLDYGKKAIHWNNCSVMALDLNGRLFKSSAKSTREFRVGLKNYFLDYVAIHSDERTDMS